MAKRKTLPNNFQEIIDKGDMDLFIATINKCDINAYGGYNKQNALGCDNLSDEMMTYLLDNGIDIEMKDTYGLTPLCNQVGLFNGKWDFLIKHGANIHVEDNEGLTPLHFATDRKNVKAVQYLLDKGANINGSVNCKDSPIEYALMRASNIDIPRIVEVSKVFIAHGLEINERMKELINKIGERFEFYRKDFNTDMIDEYSVKLEELYQLFNVKPVDKRIVHDGKSKITVKSAKWQEQFDELWDFLVPGSGPAKTVQGEMIRIAGKVRDEIYRNGGVNWSWDFRKMLTYFATVIDTKDAKKLVKKVNLDYDDEVLDGLAKMAVNWVLQHPEPIVQEKTKYQH